MKVSNTVRRFSPKSKEEVEYFSAKAEYINAFLDYVSKFEFDKELTGPNGTKEKFAIQIGIDPVVNNLLLHIAVGFFPLEETKEPFSKFES